MKKITLTYQLWVCCSQTIDVPEDYVIPQGKSGYELFEDLREKYPDHEIWDDLPDGDGDDIYIHNHLDFVDRCGMDIQVKGREYIPEFDIEEYE